MVVEIRSELEGKKCLSDRGVVIYITNFFLFYFLKGILLGYGFELSTSKLKYKRLN